METEPLKLKWQELFPKIPSIPNISASAQPMDAIKGRYLYEAGKYPEAIVLLDKGARANPVIGYSEFLKAGVYVRMGKLDSAAINATKAFYTRPKAKTYYQTLMAILSLQKDTVAIKKAFAEYDRYRHHANGYNLYLMAMLHSIGKGTPQLLQMADSGLHQFDNDTSLMVRKAEIMQFMERPVINSGVDAAAETAKAQAFYTAGINAFNKAKAGAPPANKEDYLIAARNFLKAAAITPGNYLIYENAAIAYFNMGDYTKALIYLDKVLAMNVSTNGKPEFFKGAALFNLGKAPDGCTWLKQALAKGWQEADGIIKSRCK
jgi:tetratricopeptide (TPR) repeat protein